LGVEICPVHIVETDPDKMGKGILVDHVCSVPRLRMPGLYLLSLINVQDACLYEARGELAVPSHLTARMKS
jgi:hypothetical protein